MPLYLYFTFLLIVFSYSTTAQNLLPNPSFEEVNTCKKYEEDCAPKGWRSTTYKSFRYNKFDYGVLYGIKPKKGSRFVTLMMHNQRRDYDRSFMQAALICPLEKGKQYELSFYVYPKKIMLKKMGIYFTDSLVIFDKKEKCQSLKPQLEINFDKKLMTNRWNQITAIYTATGHERGIIIGNFYTDEDTKLISIGRIPKRSLKAYKQGTLATYYGIDMLSLTPLDSMTIDCDLDVELAKIYNDSIRHYPHFLIHQQDSNIENEEDSIIQTRPVLSIAETEFSTSEVFTINNINFENNSAVLLPIAYRPLEDLANYLLMNRHLNLVITGHTDNVGQENANLILSENRAKSVAQFLINRGISNNRISSNGKGEVYPITTNETTEGRAINRRVEFKILNK